MSQTPDSAVPATPSIPADAEYSFRDVEARWAGYWEQAGTFAPREDGSETRTVVSGSPGSRAWAPALSP